MFWSLLETYKQVKRQIKYIIIYRMFLETWELNEIFLIVNVNDIFIVYILIAYLCTVVKWETILQ